MESTGPWHGKKLIWALEAQERHGRPSCSECNDRLREQRGCRRPGENWPEARVYRFTSPLLNEDEDEADSMLRECPVGHVLREAPHVYDVLGLYRYAEHEGLRIQKQPRWLQTALRVVDSEKERLRKMSESDKQLKGDAAYAGRVAKGL